MTDARTMLSTTRSHLGYDLQELADCIEACFTCTQACTSCADACVAETGATSLRRCVTTNLNCADICQTTGRVLSRQTSFDSELARAILRACAEACRLCADVCSEHGDMRHCRACAAACGRCEEACKHLLTSQ